MEVLIVDNITKHLEDLTKLVQIEISPHITIKHPWDLTPAECNSFDLVVFSGGGVTSIANHPDKHEHRLGLLRELNKPYIGICYGFQLLCKLRGATLVRQEFFRGLRPIRSSGESAEDLSLPKEEVFVYEAHQWVVRDVPDSLIPVAVSDSGIEVVYDRVRNFLGMQFHPEVCIPNNDGTSIFRRAIEYIM